MTTQNMLNNINYYLENRLLWSIFVEKMEKIDEILEQYYQKHIDLLEVRKLLLILFSSINKKSYEMKTGIGLIANERQEQLIKHKRSIEYDRIENDKGQLIQGAISLLDGNMTKMPDNWNAAICKKMTEKSYKEKLVIAGAFIAAEIDRICNSK